MKCPNCGFENIARNLEQNALFHLWMQVVSHEVGYLQMSDAKRDVKRAILGMREGVNMLTGEIVEEDFQTSTMTKKQMGEFMNKVKIWAQTELNVILPYKHEPGYDQMSDYYSH